MRSSGHPRGWRNAEKLRKQTTWPPTRSGIPKTGADTGPGESIRFLLTPPEEDHRSIARVRFFPHGADRDTNSAKVARGPSGYGSTPSRATEHVTVTQPLAANSPKLPRSKSRNSRRCFSAISISSLDFGAGNVSKTDGEIGKQALKFQKFFERCPRCASRLSLRFRHKPRLFLSTNPTITKRHSFATNHRTHGNRIIGSRLLSFENIVADAR